MKEVTLKIPNTKIQFFMELFKQLGLEIKNEKVNVPEAHQKIVQERIKNTKEEDLLNWDEIKNDFDGI